MLLKNLPWKTLVTLFLAVFFLVGAFGNIFASEQIQNDYIRWGYPKYFHYITGFFELVISVLLIIKAYRLYGAVLGMLVMGSATVTLLWHNE